MIHPSPNRAATAGEFNNGGAYLGACETMANANQESVSAFIQGEPFTEANEIFSCLYFAWAVDSAGVFKEALVRAAKAGGQEQASNLFRDWIKQLKEACDREAHRLSLLPESQGGSGTLAMRFGSALFETVLVEAQVASEIGETAEMLTASVTQPA